MRRQNAIQIEIESPSKGLVTRIPSNQPRTAKQDLRAIVVASNVRADDGVLRNAPGHEAVVITGDKLDSAPNLVYMSGSRRLGNSAVRTPIIGTADGLYVLSQQTQSLVCPAQCTLTAAFVGNTGAVTADEDAEGDPVADVASMVSDWFPDVVLHTGDMIYSGDGAGPLSQVHEYEEGIGKHYRKFVGGYSGYWGSGAAQNNFFPALGDHDWSDAPPSRFYDFFRLPNNERYYTLKRGPVQFFVVSGSAPNEPDGISATSTQGLWLIAALAASDCPHRVVVVHFPPFTSDGVYAPGQPSLRWIRDNVNVSAIVCGHAHAMEAIVEEDKPPILICGNSGHALNPFGPAQPYSVFRYRADYGALKMEANAQELTFNFFARSSDETLYTVTVPALVGLTTCYVGSAAKTVVALKVEPQEACVAIGQNFPYRAFATHWDGTVSDVTTLATWSGASGLADIGTHNGIATGRAIGEMALTASFGGLTSDETYVNIYEACVDTAMDVVLCVDRSAGMDQTAGATSDRMAVFKDAVNWFLYSLTFGTSADFSGLVSFAGNTGDQSSDAVLDSALTFDHTLTASRMDLLTPDAETDGGRSLASAIVLAGEELTTSRELSGRLGPRLVVVLISGPPSISSGGATSPESASIADAFAAAATAAAGLPETPVTLEGTTLAVIGYDIPAEHQTALRELATPGYAFLVNNPDDLRKVMGGIANGFCLYPPDPEDPEDPDFQISLCGVPSGGGGGVDEEEGGGPPPIEGDFEPPGEGGYFVQFRYWNSSEQCDATLQTAGLAAIYDPINSNLWVLANVDEFPLGETPPGNHSPDPSTYAPIFLAWAGPVLMDAPNGIFDDDQLDEVAFTLSVSQRNYDGDEASCETLPHIDHTYSQTYRNIRDAVALGISTADPDFDGTAEKPFVITLSPS